VVHFEVTADTIEVGIRGGDFLDDEDRRGFLKTL
jgi:hypothetical protein